MNERKSVLGLFLVSMATQAACGAEFDPGSRVTDFRLMAVQADAPFAAPGQTVHLRALYHEPFGRPVSFTWMTCDNPPDTSALGCLEKIASDAAKSGQSPVAQEGVGLDEIDTIIPATALDSVPDEALGNAMVGVVSVACPGALSLRDPASSSTGQLPFRCHEAGTGAELPFERWAVAMKRVYLRRTDQNQNPTIDQVTWDGAVWPDTEIKSVKPCRNDSNTLTDCKGGDRPRLSVALAPGSVESGRDELGRDFQEQVVIQYYATEGTFEFDVRTAESPDNRWVARKASAGGLQTLWFVVRDNRGGVSWVSRQVQVL